jgi:hypothetical protein
MVDGLDEEPTVFDQLQSEKRPETRQAHTNRVFDGTDWIIENALSQGATSE